MLYLQICQKNTNAPNNNYNLGEQNTVVFSYDSNLKMTFTSGFR